MKYTKEQQEEMIEFLTKKILERNKDFPERLVKDSYKYDEERNSFILELFLIKSVDADFVFESMKK